MTATQCVSEYVILVDEHDNELGLAEKISAHEKNLLHRAFSIFILRSNPHLEILLQQRAFDKYHAQGLWTNTCCSHPRSGESIIAAGERRLKEEFGISSVLKKIGCFHYHARFDNGLFENEIDHVLMGTISPEAQFTPNPDEINAYRWITPDDLRAELSAHPEQFTPWLKAAFEILSNAL